MRAALIAIGLGSAAIASGGANAAPAEGTIKGQITFEGAAPAPKKIDPTTDAAICGQQDLVEESLLVDAKTHGIKDVVLWVEGSKAQKSAEAPASDNYRCRFEPHVLVVPSKTEVVIRNRDRFLHTTLAKSAAGKQIFNVALPVKDQEAKKRFDKPGPYSLTCDVHTWMKGFVYVTNGEVAAVSDVSGRFELAHVPPGKHKVHLWHETLGERIEEVTVGGKGPADLTVKWAKK